ncbi:hypothetical protein A3F06_00205 [candidate division TM6 bacterium RIFCSPHIGHO2_12_FULL_36_22]|nr:MAG: hypothetical protein A3F06_00205 [candidate division TM6 bacterium RIFCSPHIGHO2_12_FULL_36_22]
MKKITKVLYICIVLNSATLNGYNITNPTINDIADIFMGAVDAHNSVKTTTFIGDLTGNRKASSDVVRQTFLDGLNKATGNLQTKINELTEENKKLASTVSNIDPKDLSLQGLIDTIKTLQAMVTGK